MVGWIVNLLSIGDRVTLVNSCLSSIPLFTLSFSETPKGVIEIMNASRARMVWQETQDKRKYHLVNWHAVCMPKSCGDLGILDLEVRRKYMLMKWLWKLENSEGLL